ncbi:MAG TPA: 50S ribosomal protein L11 methyltransferase [Gaiellaceae bacterium]
MLALFPEGFEEAERGEELELSAYTDSVGERRAEVGFGTIEATDVDPGWAYRWREFHRPIRAGGLWVGPPWEEPPPREPAIVIDPGRAFGTGAHPTTRLCLELLSGVPRGPLLDVGCGSGVLSIAAVRLGFAPVTAVDCDSHALEAAGRNARANGVELGLMQADGRSGSLPPAGIGILNISLELVQEIGPRLECDLLVTSGYFEAHTPRLARFSIRERRTLAGWAADLHARE